MCSVEGAKSLKDSLRGFDRRPETCYNTQTQTKTTMLDYGNDGQINEVEADDVQDTIDDILDYAEARMKHLEGTEQWRDILALCQEFHEWGAAQEGDDIGYLFMPRLKDMGNA